MKAYDTEELSKVNQSGIRESQFLILRITPTHVAGWF